MDYSRNQRYFKPRPRLKWPLIFLLVGILTSAVGLFLVGLGNGPLFPNFNYLTPESFGPQRSQSVMGVQMAFSYVGSMGIPTLFGVLGQLTTVGPLPLYLLVFFVVMVLATWKVKRILRVRS